VDILEDHQAGGRLTRTRSAEAAQATDHTPPPPAPSSDYGASPMNNLILRRSSSGAGNHGPLPIVPQPMAGAISSEMMEHLKHLGPSNLASKPKQTRYNTVKIKRGSKDESARPHQEPTEGTGRKKSNPLQVGAEASLGRNAGSESAQTPKAGYGEAERHSPEMTSHSTQTSSRSMAVPHYGTYGSLAAKNGSHSTLGSLPSRRSSRSPNRQKGVARWGSISESVIDVGGVRKVVLETTSSSEDADESNATASRIATNESSSQHGEKTNHDDANDNHEQSTGQSVSSGKKKRRRKRKKADEGETAPLLGEGR
jgi:metal transporter CNNM